MRWCCAYPSRLLPRVPLHRATAGVGLIIVMIVTIAGIRDHLSYNRALWTAVDALHQSGIPSRDINGGYIVNGWLQYVHPEHAYRNARGNIEIPWVNGDNLLPYHRQRVARDARARPCLERSRPSGPLCAEAAM